MQWDSVQWCSVAAHRCRHWPLQWWQTDTVKQTSRSDLQALKEPWATLSREHTYRCHPWHVLTSRLLTHVFTSCVIIKLNLDILLVHCKSLFKLFIHAVEYGESPLVKQFSIYLIASDTQIHKYYYVYGPNTTIGQLIDLLLDRKCFDNCKITHFNQKCTNPVGSSFSNV